MGINSISKPRSSSAFHLSQQLFSHRPLLLVAPKAKDLNVDLTIKQIPHDLKLHKVGSLCPKSQMHCELWKLRTSSNAGYDDLRLLVSLFPLLKLSEVLACIARVDYERRGDL